MYIISIENQQSNNLQNFSLKKRKKAKKKKIFSLKKVQKTKKNFEDILKGKLLCKQIATGG